MSSPLRKTPHIAVFASGNGSNAGEIFKYFQQHPSVKVNLLLSNNPKAYVLERAKPFDIPSKIFNRYQFMESDEVLNWLKEYQVTHLVLAGFLWLLPHNILTEFPDRIINIHPALLPKFGGKGMYGMKVHASVKSSGENETGITIHLVNQKYDEGKILFQAKCPLNIEDSAEQIAVKVNQLERAYYPRVIEQWING